MSIKNSGETNIINPENIISNDIIHFKNHNYTIDGINGVYMDLNFGNISQTGGSLGTVVTVKDDTFEVDICLSGILNAPTFTPNGGHVGNDCTINYDENSNIMLYSLDNGETWKNYTTSITINTSCSILAKSIRNGWPDSEISKSNPFITMSQQSLPIFNILPDTYYDNVNITISSEGADHIYYTIDGTTPSSLSNEYLIGSHIDLSNGLILKAIATKINHYDSNIANDIGLPYILKCQTPTITPELLQHTTVQTIDMSCTTTNCQIIYTTNGMEPTIENGEVFYNTPFTIDKSQTIKVKSFKNGYECSETISKSYIINLNNVAMVTTLSSTNITTTTITGNGNITDLGTPSAYQYGHCWSTSNNPTIDDNVILLGSPTSTGNYSSNITGLLSGTIYWVRAYVTNTEGISYGENVSTTTDGIIPTATTQAVNTITGSSAIANGVITYLGAPIATSYGHCWSTSNNPTISDNIKSINSSPILNNTFTNNIIGLNPYTTYYVRTYATNTKGTAYGSEETFKTLAISPSVTTSSSSSISTTSFTANGNLTNLGGPTVDQYGFCWGTSSSPSLSNNYNQFGSSNTTKTFNYSITGLTSGVLYYVRAYATNSIGTSYGNELTTTTYITPTVTTQSTSSIGTTTATGNGNITLVGVPNITQYGHCWSINANPTISSPTKTTLGTKSTAGAFTSNITGLSLYTLYYIRSYATNSAGTVYGSETSFTTSGALPSVSTTSLTQPTSTSLIVNGSISSLGTPNASQYGFCWNTSGNPTISDNYDQHGTPTTGNYSSTITGLTVDTTYYVRAYATNSQGTAYGANLSIIMVTISTPVATVITSAPYYVNPSGAGNDYLSFIGSIDSRNGDIIEYGIYINIIDGDGNYTRFPRATPFPGDNVQFSMQQPISIAAGSYSAGIYAINSMGRHNSSPKSITITADV